MTGSSFSASFAGETSATATNAGAAPGLVKDTSTANFQRDVIEESTRQPVLVDFWAPWCGPCKQLQPIIERVVNEGNGRVKLVKLNIDDHPSIPGQLGIQSIPAVIAFVGGRPVDGFMGAVPESQVRAFIDKVAGPAVDDAEVQIEAALEDAKASFDAGDLAGAADIYGAVLQADPDNLKALSGMAECMLAAGQWERARDLIASLSDEQKKDAAIAALSAKLAQIEEARKLGDPRALEQELAADPDNHAARVKLAKILNVEGDRDAATDHLISIMKRDRAWDDDGARKQLLQFLDVWGFKDPASVAARRKMSAILFS
jgi:putative thioredoxin